MSNEGISETSETLYHTLNTLAEGVNCNGDAVWIANKNAEVDADKLLAACNAIEAGCERVVLNERGDNLEFRMREDSGVIRVFIRIDGVTRRTCISCEDGGLRELLDAAGVE